MSDNEFIRINVYTKEVYNPVETDYCEDIRILPAVKELYYQYKDECNRFISPNGILGLNGFDPNDRRFYVYAWHTKTEPKMYFYIGKGTRSRSKHILDDIKEYKCGKNNPRYKLYSFLQDKYGIECEIVMNNLSDYEAKIYEQALKIHMFNNGEVLLNIEGATEEQLPNGWQNRFVEVPTIENSLIYRRYMDYESPPAFDAVDIDNLSKVYFYPWGYGRERDAQIEEELIREWIKNTSGRVYSSGSTKGVQSVIVLQYMSEERYRAFKELGKYIYSSTDVVEFLNLGWI